MVTRLTNYTKQRYVRNSTDDPGDIVFRNGDTVFLMDTQQEIIYSEEDNQWYPVPTGGGSTLITKIITANGTYSASSDNADGYSEVTVNVPGSGDTNVFQYLEFTPVTDATSTNKLNVQTDVVPSDTPWILVCAPKTNPPIPPSNEYSALVYVAGKYINQTVSSILRSDGTVGGDGGMAQYNVSTGVLKVGGSWGTYRAGQTYCVWLLTIEV